MWRGFIDDKPREECGVFGIYAPGQDVAQLTYYGLYALQHRGQESAGIAVSDGAEIQLHKNMGLVAEVFNETNLGLLKGNLAIGHVRYSTTGASSLANAQPMVSRSSHGSFCLAHNGNLTNVAELRQTLGRSGAIFRSTSDSELILNFITCFRQNSLPETIKQCMGYLKGAYSLVVMTKNQLIGVRDPRGIRPLCLGKLGKGYVLASESCALDAIGARLVRDIKPGEIVVIDESGLKSVQVPPARHRSLCIFEYIYLARQDSIIDGETVNMVRQAFGRQLARECRVDADMVIPVPDSGRVAALGYSETAGLPFKEGLTKNRYVGRTFIQPVQNLRELGVRLKFNPIKDIFKGQRVVMVDDSIVRGTTCRQIVKMLREAGAREVHFMVASPPVLYPCYYGIDTASPGQLLAARCSQEEIQKYLGVDSLYYLSLRGLLAAFKAPAQEFCTACFDGQYPIAVSAFTALDNQQGPDVCIMPEFGII
ncbi:amidophosphoribosyltransferase [Zhaonella formicivorans]|uniref:amidophosphoribosyltransferase n=1 Tax=Zhaonella formicivorans TaxID=2528593 RepID=UPI0010EE164D|nr:amidophosphoribosyltransferase [Zhaonella formicivorans]